MKRKSIKRLHSERQLRKYRIDKKRPRRFRQVTTKDMGDYEQRDVITAPYGTTTERKRIPKKGSGNWVTIYSHVVTLRYSVSQDRYFLFDRQDQCLGELSITDIYNQAVKSLSKIGAFREEIRRNNRRGTRWTLLVLKSEKAIKHDLH